MDTSTTQSLLASSSTRSNDNDNNNSDINNEDNPIIAPSEKSCWSSFWFKLWKHREPTVAETVSLLQKTVINLRLQMEHADQQATKKKEKAAQLYKNNKKDFAFRCWQSAKHYEKIYASWFKMCENVEYIMSEIQRQQQTAAVFSAFSKANNALGKIAKELDLSDLTDVLDSLNDKIQQGKEVSEILSSHLIQDDIQMDDRTTESELTRFLLNLATPVEFSPIKDNFANTKRSIGDEHANQKIQAQEFQYEI